MHNSLIEKLYDFNYYAEFVIFISGTNDFNLRCNSNNIFSTHLENILTRLIDDNSYAYGFFDGGKIDLLNFYKGIFLPINLYFNSWSNKTSKKYKINCSNINLVDKIIAFDNEILLSTSKILKRKKIDFIFVQEPNLYTHNVKTQEHEKLQNLSRDNFIKNNKEINYYYENINKFLKKNNIKVLFNKNLFHDDYDNYLVDFVHLSPEGTKKLAEDISSYIKKR